MCQCSSRQDKAEAKQGRRCYRERPMTCADCSSSRKRWRSCSSKRATRHAPHFPSQTLHSPQTPALSCLRTMPSKIHFNFMMCIPVPNVDNACHPAIVGAVVGEHRCSALALTARPTPVFSVARGGFRLYTIGPCFARRRRLQLHMTTADAHVHAAWHTQTYAWFHPADADLTLQLVRALAGRTPRDG